MGIPNNLTCFGWEINIKAGWRGQTDETDDAAVAGNYGERRHRFESHSHHFHGTGKNTNCDRAEVTLLCCSVVTCTLHVGHRKQLSHGSIQNDS